MYVCLGVCVNVGIWVLLCEWEGQRTTLDAGIRLLPC